MARHGHYEKKISVSETSGITEKLKSRRWRLDNLYWIKDKHGKIIKFKMNPAQRKLLDEMHYLNIILKSRQHGFSTFILILALDCALFNSNFAVGIVCDTLDNAKNFLKRVMFSYDRIPAALKVHRPVIRSNSQEIEFGNGSDFEVGVSLRSSTKNFLHVSEYGKLCAKSPEKAKEVKSGALNTLHQGQLGFIESTAEGRDGDFYQKTEAAKRIHDTERKLSPMEWKFHFFAWFEDPTNRLQEPYRLSSEQKSYFQELKDEHGIILDDQQKWWYAAKQFEQGEDMWKEHPSTPEEAFAAAKDGAIFAKQIRALRQLKRVGPYPVDPRVPVNTFWDWGIGDYCTIWLHQEIAGRNRFVGYYENSQQGPAHYAHWLDKWQSLHGVNFGEHISPHDFDTRRPGEKGGIVTLKSIFKGLGYAMRTVPRTPTKTTAIQLARTKLPTCEFDESACEVGLAHLENYSYEWVESAGVWSSSPRHDEHSHGADGFMTFTDGYKPKKKVKIPERKRQVV